MRTSSKNKKTPKARENADDHFVIRNFAWLRERCEFSGPITVGSKAKTMQSWIIFDTH